MNVFHRYTHLFFLQLSILIIDFFHASRFFFMASDYGDVVETRLAHEKAGNASTTSSFVVRKTVPHWDVAM